MRPALPSLIIGAWVAFAAQAQTPVTVEPAAAPAPAREPAAAPPSGHSHGKRPPARSAAGDARATAPTAKGHGVLALGATDITGNKELPKVMVIVPWKSPPDAGGVAPPADSLLTELLEPVDRSAFQRRIRYYGQLNAADRRQARSPGRESRVREPEVPRKTAPVGDSGSR